MLKELISNIPYPVGKILTKVPFRFRLGKEYYVQQKLIDESMTWNDDQRMNFIIDRLSTIKSYAQTNFPFYEELFAEYEVFGLNIKDLRDWQKIPLIDKELIRSSKFKFTGHRKINTGGTSGEPLAFYIDKSAWAREWAHMHYIWRIKGYDYRMPKITLRGKDLGTKLFQFNPIHNEFIVNTYRDFSNRDDALKFKSLVLKKKIKFVHGYPSAIFNFFSEIENALTANEIEEIKSSLRVCFLGSEFPIEYMMNYLTKIWGFDYISWYGHSEMCILAYDESKTNSYVPFLTYGYAEMCDNELIGTSFNNFDMPLIRYRTGDLIEGDKENHVLGKFSIKEGRSGDFIVDKNGKNISLTGLIFGRHHKAFDVFDFVQVKQVEKGSSTIFVTNKSKNNIENLEYYFDFSNVDIDFSYEELKEPILSKAGKFKLKV